MVSQLEHALAAHYYTKDIIFEKETERIFMTNWHMVAHVSQFPKHGDYRRFHVFDQSIFIINSGGTLKAFYNVCPHRAHELITDEAGSKKALVCNYHAWTFSTDGDLLRARGSDQVAGFDKRSICVASVALEVFCGFVFINFDPHATPLAAHYPEIEAGIRRLAPNIDTLKLSYQFTKHVYANWKVTVENYNECYHCPNVHTAFTNSVVDPNSYAIYPVNKVLFHKARCHVQGQQAYSVTEGTEEYGSFYLWPTSAIQIYPGSIVNTYHWVPLSAHETLIYRSWYFEQDTPNEEQQKLIELDRNTTFEEDIHLVNSVQRGLHSRGYQPGPIIINPEGFANASSENTTYALKRLVLDALADR